MPIKFLRLRDVATRTGYSRTHIQRLVKAGQFPKPFALGPRARAFVESEIDQWMQERAKQRDTGTPSAAKSPSDEELGLHPCGSSAFGEV